jgi:ABC-type sugar transport system ATPase subunit
MRAAGGAFVSSMTDLSVSTASGTISRANVLTSAMTFFASIVSVFGRPTAFLAIFIISDNYRQLTNTFRNSTRCRQLRDHESPRGRIEHERDEDHRSPDTLVGELSGGQRQGVAIARAMYFKSKVLILDEPTNHLSVKETAKVLGCVRGLAAQGVTGILISHNLHHVFVSCERVVAMARGKIFLDKKVRETSIDEVIELM